MGVVYEADDAVRGHRVALKTLKIPSPESVYRLKKEFRALADLNHPNLVELFDLAIDDEGTAFVTMELVAGTPMVDYCRPTTAGPFDEARARDVLRQLALAVRTLHSAGLVHRDLKPSNVIVTDTGRVVVLDLGLVADLSTFREDSLAGRIVGTAEYMAPEQAMGGDVTPAADWYSVGVLLYQVLTGAPPHEGPLLEVLRRKRELPVPPRERAPAAPADLSDLCMALLSPRAADRPDGDSVLRALGEGTATRSLARTAAFAGRAEELERLFAGLDTVRGGSPAAALVRGPSGLGKSALIRELLAQSHERVEDLVVLAGRCYEREAVPYKAMDGVIDQLASHWAGLDRERAAALTPAKPWLLGRVFSGLTRVPAVAQARRDAHIADRRELSAQAFHELRRVFAGLAEQSTLVVFIDDVQWIDADSLALLSEIARPPDAPAMLLLMCSRAETQPRLKTLLRDLEIPISTVELGPLPADDARAVAADLLGAGRARLADQIATESGGVPFVIEELVRYADAVGTDDIAAVNVTRALDARLHRLPARARRLLSALCLAGEPISARVAAAVTDASVEDASAALRLLRTERLARAAGDRVEPYHDRVRETIAGGLSDGDRRELHRKLALALELAGDGSSETLARHWHLGGEPQRAADRARAAAADAADKADFDRAARLYQLALEVGSFDERAAREIRTALAEALADAGNPPDAAAAFRAAADGAEPQVALQLRNRAAAELLRGGYLDDGMAELREVLAAVGLRLPRSPLSALLAAAWRRAWLRVRGMRWTERATSASERDLARLDVLQSVSVSLSNIDTMSGNAFQAHRMLLALRVGDPPRLADAFGIEAGYLATLGALDRAARLARIGDELYERSRERAAVIPFAKWALAAIEYFGKSNFDAAYDLFASAETELLRVQRVRGWAMSMVQQYMCFAQRYRGKFAWLARTVPRLLREAERRADIYAAVNLRTGLNAVYLLRDRPDLAAHALADAEAAWPDRDRGFQVQHVWSLFAACAIDLYAREPGRGLERLAHAAPRLRSSLLMHVPILYVEREYLRGSLAAVARGPRAAAEARRSARRLARRRVPMAAPMADSLRAVAARIDGDRKTAIALYDRAAFGFATLGMQAHAVAAQRNAGKLAGGDAGTARVAAADRWMTGERVKAPSQLARLLVPR